jgi:hypothetical protein
MADAERDLMAKLLYQKQRIEDMVRERQLLRLPDELTDVQQVEQWGLLVVEMLQERSNPDLADRLRAAHDRYLAALHSLDRLSQEWGEDLDADAKAQRARAAEENVDESEEEFDRVMADVRAFLEKSGP